jgi:hypothetical protein
MHQKHTIRLIAQAQRGFLFFDSEPGTHCRKSPTISVQNSKPITTQLIPALKLVGAKNYQPNYATHAKIDAGFTLTY